MRLYLSYHCVCVSVSKGICVCMKHMFPSGCTNVCVCSYVCFCVYGYVEEAVRKHYPMNELVLRFFANLLFDNATLPSSTMNTAFITT